MTTIKGHVGLVEFSPRRDWFLSVQVYEQIGNEAEGWYQIDGATFRVDGRDVDRAGLLRWLVELPKMTDGNRELARVALTGNWGAYATCEKAEFFTPKGP
jgi:hypothetical protein